MDVRLSHDELQLSDARIDYLLNRCVCTVIVTKAVNRRFVSSPLHLRMPCSRTEFPLGRAPFFEPHLGFACRCAKYHDLSTAVRGRRSLDDTHTRALKLLALGSSTSARAVLSTQSITLGKL